MDSSAGRSPMTKNRTIRHDDPLAQFRAKKLDTTKSSPAAVLAQEQAAAALVGGRRHSGSGAKMGARSDASSERFQIECKQTGNRSIGLSLDWLTKITHEAQGCGREPLMHFEFLAAPPDVSRRWVLMSEWMFQKLLSASQGALDEPV